MSFSFSNFPPSGTVRFKETAIKAKPRRALLPQNLMKNGRSGCQRDNSLLHRHPVLTLDTHTLEPQAEPETQRFTGAVKNRWV